MVTKWRQITKTPATSIARAEATLSGTINRGENADCEECIDCTLRDCALAEEVGAERYRALINALEIRRSNVFPTSSSLSPLNPNQCYTIVQLRQFLATMWNSGSWVTTTAAYCSTIEAMTQSTPTSLLTGQPAGALTTVPTVTLAEYSTWTFAELETRVALLTRRLCNYTVRMQIESLRIGYGNPTFQIDVEAARDDFVTRWNNGERFVSYDQVVQGGTSVAPHGTLSTTRFHSSFFGNQFAAQHVYHSTESISIRQDNIRLSDVTVVKPTTTAYANQSGVTVLCWKSNYRQMTMSGNYNNPAENPGPCPHYKEFYHDPWESSCGSDGSPASADLGYLSSDTANITETFGLCGALGIYGAFVQALNENRDYGAMIVIQEFAF